MIGYKIVFDVGCPRQIRGRTTIPLVKRIILALPNGLLKVLSSGNGNRLVVFSGSMVVVRESSSFVLPLLIVLYVVAGSGKSVLWYVLLLLQLFFLGTFMLSTSSSIIEELHNMRQVGLATVSFFYFDFRDHDKQDIRSLLSSNLIQLCGQSDRFSDILSTLFTNHCRGSRQPSEDALMECLKNMLKLPGQGSLYLSIDGLDECPNSSGYLAPREQVLNIVQELIDLQLPHVRFCITSRPEIDIRTILEPLAAHNVPLDEQAGQKLDIVGYINDRVRLDTKMRRWREEDKQMVIDTLTRKADGM